MKLLKNKLFVALLCAGVAMLISFYLKQRPTEITEEGLFAWIENGYTQQFCNIIYPQMANCVTLAMNECPSVAKEQITSCIQANKVPLQNATTPAEAKKQYFALGACFEQHMHAVIVQKYLVNTPECQQKLGIGQ